MRVLVLGATGMLGSEAIRVLSSDFEVWGACRNAQALPFIGVPSERIVSGLDAMNADSVDAILDRVAPDIVINAVGIIKQRDEAKAAIPSIAINSLWPHLLAKKCEERGIRMIHVSTDCVFSGHTTPEGGYRESDFADAYDLYGRSKLLGEVIEMPNVVTLRTSIIGWQFGPQTSLIGWFASHRHEHLKGFTKAIFSGLTTTALTEMMRDIVFPRASLTGLYHVSAEPIDKFTLLTKLASACGWEVDIEPSDELVVDKTLNSERFQKETDWIPPTWDAMLEDLAVRKPV